jgi:hypothetical protein
MSASGENCGRNKIRHKMLQLDFAQIAQALFVTNIPSISAESQLSTVSNDRHKQLQVSG